MRDHLYLFFFIIHCSTGCILTDERQTTVITAYTGGSVLLPCSCADPQSTADTFTWLFERDVNQWIQVFEDEKYSGRRELFNEGSPNNLSLLISDLREEDQEYYMCTTKQYKTYIQLEVKGCNLVQNRESLTAVTGYSGESVVLPCSCTELQAKPEQIRWMYYLTTNEEIYPKEKSERHKNRVKLLNQTTPGNLSLHISALTADHGGFYTCSVSSQHVFYRLQVKEKPHIQTVGLSTHQPSHQTQELTHQPSHQTQELTHQPSHQTQELTPPRPPQHTPQYVFIMVGVILSVLLLAFIYWRCRGNVKKETSDDEEQDDQDDLYTTVVYVQTAYTPAPVVKRVLKIVLK